MCDEKRMLNIETHPHHSPTPNPNSPTDMMISEFYIGNPNHSTTPITNDTDPNPTIANVDTALNENGVRIGRIPSDPGIFSTSFVRYIDWGPAEFIDDF